MRGAFDQGDNVVVGLRSIVSIIQFLAILALIGVIVVPLLTRPRPLPRHSFASEYHPDATCCLG